MSHIHINQPSGHYIGQVRYIGGKKWDTVTGRCKSAESATAKAVLKMKKDHFRARALFIDDSGWYGPTIVMEVKR